MSMTVGQKTQHTEFTPYTILGLENPDASRVIEVEFRNLEMDVNQYIDIDINSKTLTKSKFQDQIIAKTGWKYPAGDLKIFNCCGEWTEPLLNDPANQGFVDFLRDKKIFQVVFRRHDY